MRKKLILYFASLSLLLAGCGQADKGGKGPQAGEERAEFYTTQIQYSGENDSDAKYLEIARRSDTLFPLLEEHLGAFVVDAYHFQSIDDKGTPLYTQNTHRYPAEIAPNGRSIRVSRNYFLHNPIKTADGSPLEEQFIYDDTTLTLLVPEQYRAQEADILAAYREGFYFEKVTAENDFNEMAGLPDRLTLAPENLSVHIIYVKEGQSYDLFRSDCGEDGKDAITDPIVQLYTSNIHCNYAHSFLSQWTYLPGEGGTAAEVYEAMAPYVEEVGAQESLRKVVALQ